MSYFDTKRGPVTEVHLNHPTHLPVYQKVRQYARHAAEGPPILLLCGGSGARELSETLIHYTHHSVHVLPTFDDGGSSRELRLKFDMPPPGDLRNRLMALSDMSKSGNPEVSRLFQTRLPASGSPKDLEEQLLAFLDDGHPQMAKIEARYRRIILNHLDRFVQQKPQDFDLRRGSIGNFVIAGAYLSIGDMDSVIFEFSALAAVRGQVYSVCSGGGRYHLRAVFEDGQIVVGQSSITGESHPPISELAIVERNESDWAQVSPPLNPLVAQALRKTSLVAYTMGSFYTSLVSNLLVAGMGEAIRQCRRPKVFVANLRRDEETPEMTVSMMLKELFRYVRRSDPNPGAMSDYVNYVLVGTHGESSQGGRVPIDLERIKELGVEPIVLPLERVDHKTLVHDVQLVTAALLSLC